MLRRMNSKDWRSIMKGKRKRKVVVQSMTSIAGFVKWKNLLNQDLNATMKSFNKLFLSPWKIFYPYLRDRMLGQDLSTLFYSQLPSWLKMIWKSWRSTRTNGDFARLYVESFDSTNQMLLLMLCENISLK